MKRFKDKGFTTLYSLYSYKLYIELNSGVFKEEAFINNEGFNGCYTYKEYNILVLIEA